MVGVPYKPPKPQNRKINNVTNTEFRIDLNRAYAGPEKRSTRNSYFYGYAQKNRPPK